MPRVQDDQTVRSFTHADVRRILAQPQASPTELQTLSSYRDHFNSQPVLISAIYGYSRALRSDYEIDLTEHLLAFGDHTLIPLLAKRLHLKAQASIEQHEQVYTPIRQAVEVIIAYGTAIRILEGESWEDLQADAYPYRALLFACRATASAFRDIALHMLLTLAGGDAVASEWALQHSDSFKALRTFYGVHIDTETSNLNSWRIALAEEIQSLTQRAAELAEEHEYDAMFHRRGLI